MNSPFWNLHSRGVRPTEAELTQIFTAEELERATAGEVNARILELFQYDDFAWQKQRGIRTPYKKRAEGLHKVLYQCPRCGTEYRMDSAGTELFCRSCGKRWQMTEYGEMVHISAQTR